MTTGDDYSASDDVTMTSGGDSIYTMQSEHWYPYPQLVNVK